MSLTFSHAVPISTSSLAPSTEDLTGKTVTVKVTITATVIMIVFIKLLLLSDVILCMDYLIYLSNLIIKLSNLILITHYEDGITFCFLIAPHKKTSLIVVK